MIKVKQFNVVTGDIKIIPRDDRWYEILEDVEIHLYLNDNTRLVYKAKAGMMFDGRSGGPLADLFVPNLGSQRELACWLCHDIGAYALYLSYDEINDVLAQMLVLSGRSKFKAWMVKSAVSITDDWYGEPNKNDKEWKNLRLITVRHYAK